MKKIRIISGTYGLRGNGYTVIRKTPEDPPFDVSDDEAIRLVKLKVAKIIEEQPKPQFEEPVTDPADSEDQEEQITEALPTYDASMKLAELKEVAAAYGVDASKAKSKAEVIAMIEAAQAEDLPDEEPPEISAALPV